MWNIHQLIRSVVFFITISSIVCQNEADYRLPTNIDSISYIVTLQPEIESLSFTSNLEFVFVPLASTPVLILNSKNLIYSDGSLKIFNSYGIDIAIDFFKEDENLERIYIKPVKQFEKGQTYKLVVNYNGRINEDGVGLYFSDYTGENGETERMIVSQLRPVHARRVFPCLDEPAFRAHFTIKIIHDPELRPVSNMPVKGFTTLKNGLCLTEFETTPPIPAFLVALFLSKLPEYQGKGGFFAMATPENFEGIKYSAEIGPKLAAAMQYVADIAYPLNKTHQVALPKLIPVAMENWGLYSFKERNILYVEGESPTVQKQTAARFSGHEVCHAWMGNMVSLGWWDYLWMSEVFAMYYEYLLPHMVDKCWRMEEQMVIDLHQSGLLDDSVPVAPLTTKVLTPTEISNKFGGVTYTKGPGVLRMVMHILGHDVYLQGFRKLLLKLAYKSVADPETLWAFLSSYSKELPADLATLMSEWTTTSGYPVVNVLVTRKNLLLSQSKFALDEKDKSNTTWWIPLTYTTKSECDFLSTKPKGWFSPSTQMISIDERVNPHDWVLFNVQSAGFYRVNYDLENWGRLIAQLHQGHLKIIPLNRAQLVDDSLNLARAGRVPYRIALSLAGYLAKEIDFIPWRSAIKAFSFLRTALLNSAVDSYLNTYLAGLVVNAYEHIGWDEKECDEHTTKINREEIVRLACETGLKDCIDRSIAYVNSLIEGHQKRISVDVRQTALCTAVRVGNDEIWTTVKSWYERAQSVKDSTAFLDALTCKSIAASRFLLESLKRTPADDWNTRFSAFAARATNANSLLFMLKDNRSLIERSIGKVKFDEHLKTISQFLTTEKEFQVLEELVRTGVSGLDSSLLAFNDRITWRRKFVPQIQQFFSKNTEHELIFKD